MANSKIEAALDEALDAFRDAPGTPEAGLDVDDPALYQDGLSIELSLLLPKYDAPE